MSAAEITSWLRECGLDVSAVEMDGKLHRVPGIKSKRKDGWYVAHAAPVVVCVAGDWSRGSKWSWRKDVVMSFEEKREATRLQRQARELAEEARRLRQSDVAAAVRRRLESAASARNDHPYLVKKRIAPLGVLQIGDELIVPNRDVYGTIWGAQRIAPDGRKLWHREQRKSETFFLIGDIGARAFICEGFATGASIHMATGHAVACAFDTKNLKGVALALKAAYSATEWIVAADDDFSKKDNPGFTHAEGAARAISAKVIVPIFPSQQNRGTDFNDLAIIEGLDAVKKQLQGAQPMATVTDINRQRSQAQGEMTFAEFAQALVEKMRGSPRAPAAWPPFPRRFHVVSDSKGRRTALEELADEIVVHRDLDEVTSAILTYCWEEIAYEPAVRNLDAEKAVKCRNMWLRLAQPLPERPNPVLERSQRGLTFKRLSFDAPAGWDGPQPEVFEEFLSRCSQPMAVCSFIGSLFYPEADRQQYLYFFGEGGDGKGALMRLLKDLLGSAAQALYPPKANDRFWNMNIYGKRLGLFFDCADWAWFGSAHFKSLTGGDPLFFEDKGVPGFTDYSACKIVAASNTRPKITSQKSDLRRLIFIHVKPSGVEQDPTYENRLRSETEAIVRTCKEIYLQECPKHGSIRYDAAVEVALEAEAHFLDIFWARFEPCPGHILYGEDVRPILAEAGIRSNNEIGKLKDCWGRLIPGVVIDHTNRGTEYRGMRKLSAFEIHPRGPE